MKHFLLRYALLFGLFGLLFSLGCNNTNEKNVVNSKKDNKFADPNIQQIYELEYQRNSEKLSEYLLDENPIYRETAALAYASVQDTLMIGKLSQLLSDDVENVRYAASFALGQTFNKGVVEVLKKSLEIEQTLKVKACILEALGKCGTMETLNYIASINFAKTDFHLLSGQAWALARFSIRKISSDIATQKALELIAQSNPEKIRSTASIYFARSDADFSSIADRLINLTYSDGSIATRSNILLAMRNVVTDDALQLLREFIFTQQDKQLKISAIRSLYAFDYDDISTDILSQLTNTNANVAIIASEYFIDNGKEKDAKRYVANALKNDNWRVKANLLKAAIKFTASKEVVSKKIKSEYRKSKNPYEQAILLGALSYSVQNYEFVANEVFHARHFIIASTGFEEMVAMRKTERFEELCKKIGEEKAISFFAAIFKKAIKSEDNSLMAQAAIAIRDPELKLNEYYQNTYFIEQAKKRCKLPQGLETYIELQKTLNYINGEDSELEEINHEAVSWEVVKSLKDNQKAKIVTTKGNITIELFTEQTPATVANFIKLIKKRHYVGNIIHRVVPNFVVQAGCTRGDGWSGSSYTIRSEFRPVYFEAGMIGMASAGKDTESAQWFITHIPTPHLDGRYTIFGKVVQGMNVLHQLEVNDRIENIEID